MGQETSIFLNSGLILSLTKFSDIGLAAVGRVELDVVETFPLRHCITRIKAGTDPGIVLRLLQNYPFL